MTAIPAILHCPHCHRRHVDEGEWATRVHTTHLCAFCGEEFDVSHPQCFGAAGVLASGHVPGPERRVHELKTWRVPFQALVDGIKTFEIRENDRDYREQDVLVLKEFDNVTGAYTGRVCTRVVAYMVKGPAWGLPEPTCVLGLDDGRVDDLLAANNALLTRARRAEQGMGALRAARDAIRQPMQVIVTEAENIATVLGRSGVDVKDSAEALVRGVKRMDGELGGGAEMEYEKLVAALMATRLACDVFEKNSHGAMELQEALRDVVALLDNAGLMNLSRGVQLGATSWYVKISDACTRARALAGLPEPDQKQSVSGIDDFARFKEQLIDEIKVLPSQRGNEFLFDIIRGFRPRG